ncbi:MAG: PBP1A family penicillin-binding protein [bacterium]|nr:PBP1A family penicillin-binding protein [bacterium]
MKKRKPWRLIVPVLRWSIIATIWASILAGALVGWYALDLPDPDRLISDRTPSVTVLDSNDRILATYGDFRGEIVPFDRLPPDLVAAVIAVEDRRFFDHGGMDVFGVLRALVANLRAGEVVQGGSTITQQVIKNVFLTPERSLKRKIQEVLLAFWLERKFTKEEIFAIYLNRVYLGAGAFGIAAASHRYFGKKAGELSLGESAMIAGLLKAPSRDNPFNNPGRAIGRTTTVIDSMVDAGFIERDRARRAKATPLVLAIASNTGGDARYATDWVTARASEYIGVATRNLIISTTIDATLQEKARNALVSGLADGGPASAEEGAIVSMGPDGAVVAMVGGSGYSKTQFNRAVHAYRQPGSAFKLFVYLAALEAGWHPDTGVEDRPVTINGWSPGNFRDGNEGMMTLADAFAGSVNTVAADTAWKVGIANVIEVAHRLGIDRELPEVPSLALGTTELSLVELTGAYGTMANQGLATWPWVIREIRTSSGEVLYRRHVLPAPRLIEPAVHAAMTAMLGKVMEDGTGRAAQIDWPAGGKTGTSQDFRDAWFIGFTRQYVTGVWVGNDDGSPTGKVTGGGLPARIWAAYMSQALAGEPSLKLVDHAPPPATGDFTDLVSDLLGELTGDSPDSRQRGPEW